MLQHPGPLTGNRPDIELIEIDRLRADLDQAQTRLTAALDKQESARLAASQATVNTRQSLYVLDAPTIPDKSTISLRQTALQSSLFVAVGVLLTILAVVGGAILDRSFLLPLDVSFHLGLPVLATVPDTAPRRRRFQRPPKHVSDDVVVRSTPALRLAFHYESHQPSIGHALTSRRPAKEPGRPVEQAE